MTRRTILAGLVAALAGSLVAVALAHTTTFKSSLSINAYTSGGSNEYVWGVVTSESPKCAAGWKVRVFRRRHGDDAKLGAVPSNDAASGLGGYTVTAPTGNLPQGPYYSQVRKRDLRPGPAHDHICKGSESPEVDVGP
jgi:hypothetical protein